MSREIKFRCWDISRKQWEKIEYYNLISLDGNFCEYSMGKISTRPKGEYVLEQFTGGKDDNGVNVFEGDIIKCEDGNGEEFITTVKEKGVVEVFHAEYNVILLEWACGNGDIESIEIIGNIHENPELLNETS